MSNKTNHIGETRTEELHRRALELSALSYKMGAVERALLQAAASDLTDLRLRLQDEEVSA